MSNVKRNFFYSSILTTANYIFPLLTYPYVTRVLGVANIGICNFVDSFINYFILFSMMGMGVVGVRAIAENKQNETLLNQTFSSLFIINAISTGVALCALIGCILFMPELKNYTELLWLGAFKLVFNFLLIDWLYRGLEDFKYITSRSIFVRSLYVIAVFVFVRHERDYPIYYLLSVGIIIVNAVINCRYSHKYVSVSFSGVSLKKHLKPFIILGLYTLLTSMYTTFNVVYLGFIAGDTQVGYYTTATKLYGIILSLFTAFTTVMLPRISSLLAAGEIDQFKSLINKSLSVLITFSIPAIIFSIAFSSEIISLVAGSGYDGAVIPMRIVMPLIFIIGFEQILVIQILMPLKKDKIIFVNSIIGATLGLLLNVILVGKFQSIGSSCVWVSCEIVISSLSLATVKKSIAYKLPLKELLKNIFWYLPLTIILYVFLHYQTFPTILSLIIGFAFTLTYIIICQFTVFKGSLVHMYVLKIIKRM